MNHDPLFPDFQTYFVGNFGVLVHNVALGKATCDNIAALFSRYRIHDQLDAITAWARLEEVYLVNADEATFAAALEKVVREELFGGSQTALIWTKGTPQNSAVNIFEHYKKHVLLNYRQNPAGDLAYLKGNAFKYVQEAIQLAARTDADVVRWTQPNGNLAVLCKTPPPRIVFVRGVGTEAGALSSYFQPKLMANNQPITLFQWASDPSRGYTGAPF